MLENESTVRDELRAIARDLERAVRLGEDDQAMAARNLRRLSLAIGEADIVVRYSTDGQP